MSGVVNTLRWQGGIDGHLVLLDQTRLPAEIVEIDCTTVEEVSAAIQRLAVRGAPAIGCAAAYGVCLGEMVPEKVGQACDILAASRPTAVNLFWALDRMRRVANRFAARSGTSVDAASQQLAEALFSEAQAIQNEDREMCTAIGCHGADLLANLAVGSGILTHCNAGALATGGDGTALSVIFELARQGRRLHVWVDETRPLLQGARLTTWELMQRNIDCTLICDSMAAQVMREGRVQAVITGADRIAANGDAANKIGTYGVALLAAAHDIPFYVAAPSSSFDCALAVGDDIPIENRPAAEVTHGFGQATAPSKVTVYNPAFDVTPAELLAGIITERGIIQPVDSRQVARVLERKS